MRKSAQLVWFLCAVLAAVAAVGFFRFRSEPPAPLTEAPAESATKSDVAAAPPHSAPGKPPPPAGAAAAQDGAPAGKTRPAAEDPAPTAPAVPFRAGEILRYHVAWSYFSAAASVELRSVERRPFYGRQAWHFQATARTNQPVRAIYELDDQFDSYTDARTLTGMQWEMHLNEQGRKVVRITRLAPSGQPGWGDGPAVAVPAGTRDPLGLIYYLRTVDWGRQARVEMPVHDGRQLYDVVARRMARGAEAVVPGGTFNATRIEIRLYQRGSEVRGHRFELWLAEDPARTPVLITATLPFGELRVELREPPQR